MIIETQEKISLNNAREKERIGKTIISTGYMGIRKPDHPKANNRGYVKESTLIVEKILGKPLPLNSVIHHINHIKIDNRNCNLIICQDEAHHQIIHRRERAYKACGNSTFRKCTYCKQWDDPKNLYVTPIHSAFHYKCANDRIHQRKKYKQVNP